MNKEDYVDVENTSKSWNFGVYPSLLEFSLASFSNRPLRQAGSLLPILERSFASAVCSLSAFQIEGMLQRLHFDRKTSPKVEKAPELDELLKMISSPKRQTAIRELSVVRDSIAHGNLYKTKIKLNSDGLRTGKVSEKTSLPHGIKFSINVSRNRTKILKLNVNPGNIGFPDAVLSVALVNIIYKELENRTVDMPINRFVVGSGYDSNCPSYFGDYIRYILKDLDKRHRQSVNNKLKTIRLL